MKEKRILGYFNVNSSYPSTLVIVYETEGMKSSHPKCQAFDLKGNFKSNPNFVVEQAERYLGDNEFAYGISKERILVGSADYITKELAAIIKEDKLSDETIKSIKNYIDDSC